LIAGKGVGRMSQCEPLAAVITAKVDVELSAQRIYQDLVAGTGFNDFYQSVKRFVRKLQSIAPAGLAPALILEFVEGWCLAPPNFFAQFRIGTR
jgi:hypothetical protein